MSDLTPCSEYRASEDSCEYYDPDGNYYCRWRPSIHMPRWASRILLEMTDVRIERLQDITEEQAIAEGYEANPGGVVRARDLMAATHPYWDANPWVWCVEFKRIQP